MMQFTDAMLKKAFGRPERTPEEKLRIVRAEFRHFLRGYHDADFIERQALFWARKLMDLESEVRAAGGNVGVGTDLDEGSQ